MGEGHGVDGGAVEGSQEEGEMRAFYSGWSLTTGIIICTFSVCEATGHSPDHWGKLLEYIFILGAALIGLALGLAVDAIERGKR